LFRHITATNSKTLIYGNSVWQWYSQGCKAELSQVDSGLVHKFFSLTLLRDGLWEPPLFLSNGYR